MPEIDEISVRMSVITEDFVSNIDEAISDGIKRAEDFESRVRELADSLTELAKGSGFAGEQIRKGGTFGDLEEDVQATAGLLESFEANAQGFSEVISAISEEFSNRVTEMTSALGTVLPEDLGDSLGELAETEIRASKTSEELSERLQNLVQTVVKVSLSTGPAAKEFDRVGAELEELGVVVPIKKLAKFKEELVEENVAANEAGETIEQINQRMRNMGDAFIKSNTNVHAGHEQMGEFEMAVTGVIKKLAPAAIAISVLYKAWSALNAFVKEAVQISLDVSESQRLLTVAVREHQRAVEGQSHTIEEASEFAEQLSDTYGRTRLEMLELTREALFLTNELKLTNDQVEGLAEASVIVAESFGSTAETALRSFTNFLLTGYTQGLRQFGFSLDQNSLKLEAIRRNYIDLGDEMDAQTQTLVGLELIMERTNDIQDDVIAGQSALQQRLEATTAEMDKQKQRLGDELAPAWVTLQEVVLGYVENMAAGIMGVFGIILFLDARLQAMTKTLVKFLKTPVGQPFDAQAFFNKTEDELLAKNLPDFFPTEGIDESLLGLDERATRLAQSFGTAADGMRGFSDAVIVAGDKALPMFNKEAQKLEAGLLRVEQKLDQTLLNIQRQFESRRLALQMNLAKNLASLDRQANERRTKISTDFQLQEEREKQDHLLRMARMEEDFLFNLDDAVRERDAKAVLLLQRQHNVEKKRAMEDFKNKKTRRADDFRLEIKEIERQRALRRQLALDEFNERMAMLAEDERLRSDRAREDAEKQKQLLNDQLEDRLRLVVKGLGEELNLNAEELQQLFQLMEQYYGANGWFVQLVGGYYDWLAGQGNIGTPGIPGTTSGADIPVSGIGGILGFQRGGDFIATSPQLIRVAEGSPERVQITPLTGATMTPRGGAGMRGGNNRIGIDLDIALGEGLMAEVADQVMSETADVIVNIRRGGGR